MNCLSKQKKGRLAETERTYNGNRIYAEFCRENERERSEPKGFGLFLFQVKSQAALSELRGEVMGMKRIL